MAMAHRGPKEAYDRRVNITEHAVESLMKRMDSNEHGHRGERGLGNLLDKAICERLYHKDRPYEEWYERVGHEVVLNQVVDLRDYFDDLFAVVRKDNRERGSFVCVTVLERAMVERNKVSGQWGRTADKVGDQSLKSSPFAGLADVVPTRPQPTLVKGVVSSSEDALLPQMMVTWVEGGSECRLVMASAHVEPFVKSLLEKDATDIQLWAERELKIQRTVTVDFDL
jgi:hypothetical protein